MKNKLLTERTGNSNLPRLNPRRLLHAGVHSKWKQGFSLVELMISLVVSTVILGALFTVCIKVQEMSTGISSCVEKRSNLHLAPILLSQWIKGAGMNIFESPENYLKISKGELGLRSDNKGNQGLPDGDTDDSFENISFRAYNKELKIKCLNGGYQPFLKGITGLEAALEERSLVTLNLSRQYDFLDSGLPGSMETKLQLWNLKPNLFPEIKP